MNLHRFLQKAAEPITRARAHATKSNRILWENKKRKINKLRQYRAAYENGGYISEAIDLYPLYMLSNGYTVQAAKGYESKKDEIQQLYDKLNLSRVAWMLASDSLIVMDGIAEIVFGKGKARGQPIRIYNRPAECFEVAEDEYGNIIAYIQKYDTEGNALKSEIVLEPKNTLHLQLLPRSDSVYGLSLIRRAEDDINRDVDCIESVANGIKIHGTPKYLTRVNANRPDAVPLSKEEFTDIENQFLDINSKDSFVVEGDVDTKMLDVSGVTGVAEYSDTTMERVCAGLGVPEELVGMRKGSTDATAVSRINAFFKKIQTYQLALAQCINTSIIDPYVGQPGKVWIEYNDPDPTDNLKEAQYCEALGKINGMDPFSVMSAEQMRARLGIDEEEYQMQEGEEKI